MSASNAVRNSHPNVAQDETLQQPVAEIFVMLIERGKTDKYGWLSAFDELSDYLGRLP
jgi:hypothetical protein